MIQITSQEEQTVVNRNFIQQLERDIGKYDILYIFAPLGWGVYAFLTQFYRNYFRGGEQLFWLEETENASLEKQIEQLPTSGKRVFLIPRLERIIEQGQQELIWELLSNKKKGDVFLFASSISLPERLLPYTILNKYIGYGIDDLRPTTEDVARYMKSRGILLSKEELFRIEKDSDNLPLFIQMLANLLCSTNKRYNRAIREQCFEDIFSFTDVMFFRTFTEEDQNALLKLSCFDELDNHLISYMLDIPRNQVENFIERLLNKSSTIQKSKDGWKFFPLFKQFLERAIQKYFDYEERLADYQKAMFYLMSQKKWFAALRFAYILQDKEQLAICLDNFLAGQVDYSIFITLEDYFRELTIDNLVKHPELMIAGSILKAIIGDVRASRRYEKVYLRYMEQIEDEKLYQKLQSQLLFMYLTRPGNMREDVLEKGAALLDSMGDSMLLGEGKKFQPHYISILRGEQDYCHYFRQNGKEFEVVERLRKITDRLNDRSFSIMLKFMEAEVLYERNELDHALNVLVKTTKEAGIDGNQRMHQLCTLAMIDLLAAKNQLNSMETFQLEKLEEDDTLLFTQNCQAHTVYYNLLKNNKEFVLAWMKENSPDETERFYVTQDYQYLMKAKVYVWMEQYVRARMILQILLDFAVEHGMSYLETQVRLLEAVIYFKEGSSLWKETLLPALEWGKELGFIRVFADEGAAVYELFSRIAQEEKNWAQDAWFKKVLSATKAQMLQYPKYLKKEKQGDVGDFSSSEQAVMRLLVLGEKNAEIAGRLCVSENTVKYHLKNIYQKLHVKSRSQAINKIKEYELI